MTKKEMNELKKDRDGDGIPDKYDSTFNPPDREDKDGDGIPDRYDSCYDPPDPPEVKTKLALASPELREYLTQHHFSFSNVTSAHGMIEFAADDMAAFRQHSRNFEMTVRKGGRGR